MQHISKVIHIHTDSPIEETVYEELIKYGLEPRTQFPVGMFRIDLAFPKLKLAIEADGKDFHSSEEQKKRDWYRQSRLEEQGWKFERFDGSFIHRFPRFVAAKIALQYFREKLTPEQDKLAVGSVVSYFTSKGETEFASDLSEVFLKGYKLKKI